MHDSLNPLTGLMPMIGMWLNATFGGVGVGMINMFLYIILAVFIAGMMVGPHARIFWAGGWRRRGQARDPRALRARLLHPRGYGDLCRDPMGTYDAQQYRPARLQRDALRVQLVQRQQRIGLRGSRRQYRAWNVATGLVMLLARFIPIILPLAIAGSLCRKRPTAESAGTLGVEDGTFAGMLLATILFVGALTFFPAAALGRLRNTCCFTK